MKYKKILSQTIVLLGLFAMVFSFNGNSMRENLYNSTNFMMPNDSVPGDTTYTDIYEPMNPVFEKDLSSSFNESGFYKSNSSNKNGTEVINDFNGNLCYQIPIAYEKCKGDISLDLSLNYNGNVSYNIIGGEVLNPHIYNFMAPGWIFSVNGFAVQMMNFERNMFTNPASGTEALGPYVHLLPEGYYITKLFHTPSPSDYDKITIMLGDGSTETLENETSGLTTGNYYSTSKSSFVKAIVRYTDPGESPYRPRTMYLMKGDGLTYVFYEHKYQYFYENNNEIYHDIIPNTFILESIVDRFGHSESLSYDNPYQGVGRPKFYSCSIAAFYYYPIDGVYNSIYIATGKYGDCVYKISADEFSTDVGIEHRPRINQIIDPSGEIMTFSYKPCTRYATNIYKNGNSNISVRFSDGYPLYRLSNVKNFDGGEKKYTYFGYYYQELNYNPGEYQSAHNNDSNKYFGQGRDLFFSNMIDTVYEIENGVNKNRTTFSYEYLHPGRYYDFNVQDNIWRNPVHENDSYITTRTVTSLDNENLNETPQSFQNRKIYKNYKTNRYVLNNVDYYSGTFKLVEDKFIRDGEDPEIKIMNYGYYTGVNTDINSVFNGSFLDSVKIENYNVGSNNYVGRNWKYSFSGGYSAKFPPTMKSETDPLGKVTKTYLRSFEKNNFYVYADGIYKYTNPDSTAINFYLIDMPDSIIVSKGTDRLQKKEIVYFDPVSVIRSTPVSGYTGQVYQEREINPLTNDVIRSISFVYCNKDTTGKYLVSPESIFTNPNEGNIKEFTDANGNKTKYYYDIVSKDEDEQYTINNRRLSYHKFKDDGTESVESIPWNDARFPTRFDRYITNDRYLTNYQLYNGFGSPTMVVSENKYVSQAEYDNYFRLKRLTLPYDFSDISPDTSYTPVEMSVPISVVRQTTKYGVRNEKSGTNSSLDYMDPFGKNIIQVLHMGAPDYNNNDTAYNILLSFMDPINWNPENPVDSAFLFLYPFSIQPFYFLGNDKDTIDYDFCVKPIKTFDSWISQYAEGKGVAHCGNMNFRLSTDCAGSSQTETEQLYRSYERKLDVRGIMQRDDTTTNHKDIYGLKLSMEPIMDPQPKSGKISLLFNLFSLCNNFTSLMYASEFGPCLVIYGHAIHRDSIRTINYHSGSLIYSYNDRDNIVTVKSKIDKNATNSYRFKTTDNYFDGFGRLKQTKTHLPNDSAFYTTDYNYLGQKAKLTDAMNNSTKFSYDKYGIQSKTENADNSQNLVSSTYQNNLSTYYTTYNGFVNKQVYTDETGRKFDKYYDAVGNLIREVKYVDENTIPDVPPDFDSTAYMGDSYGEVSLITDYRYDDLYRIIDVRTPQANRISYTYDALGRQSSRTTPDAGLTKYIYDKNNNLIYSQDANQRTRGNNIYTFRNYDGLNRLISIGETQIGTPNPEFDVLDTSQTDFIGNSNEMLTVNVYDSLSYGSSSIFSNTYTPSDYYISGKTNNTKGALVATAYRTNISDNWSYKFYRYDARGRVIKMWHYINGLEWKTMVYNYNSQNQVTYLNYQPSVNENKLYRYSYDSVARLTDVSTYSEIASEESEEDYIGTFTSFASYAYNKNSQISHYKFNNNSNDYIFGYNNRNWVSNFGGSTYPSKFDYILTYLTNGNIRQALYTGDYKTQLANNSELRYNYIYDKSNRLNKADYFFGSTANTFDAVMSYDYDGNLLTLKRYGSNENMIDNLTYSYYVNTSRINSVDGQSTQYVYDANGNLTGDSRDGDNVKQDMKYDYRNLLTEMRLAVKSGDSHSNTTQIYQLKFDYDEAGNRVRKREYLYQGQDPSPIFNNDNISKDSTQGNVGTGDGNGTTGNGGTVTSTWRLVADEYYSRDVSGKEIAVYHSYNLDHWNVWGTDNVGKINANGSKFFYIKDHLGSVRVVLNSDNQIVSAIDYDCWGYPLENRSYQSDGINYKFTGKQRDTETGYDYFGARYYDAKIGRWGGVEPVNKNIYSNSPYSYAFSNPIAFIDSYGFYPRIWQDGSTIYIQTTYYYVTDRDDKNYGLNQSQVDKLKRMVENMNKWSGTFKTKDGKELILSVAVSMHNINRPFNQSLNYFDMVDIFRRYFNDGFSFIQNVDKISNSKSNRGVSHEEGGDVLHVTRNMDPYETTGAHEFGHSLFLPDENSNSNIDDLPSIMKPVDVYPNGDIKRNNPEMEDRLKVYEALKINKKL